MNRTTGTVPARPQARLYTNLDEDGYEEKVRGGELRAARGFV